MKKFILIVLLSAAMVAVSGLSNALFGKDGSLKGSGNLLTRTMEVSAFNGITARHGVKVKLVDHTEDNRIIVVADDNLIDRVSVRVDKGILIATIDYELSHIRKQIRNVSDIHVTITVPVPKDLASLHASSGAEITGEKLLDVAGMEIKAASGAQIEAQIKAASCNVDADSGAEIDCDIEAQQCDVKGSSGAELDLKGSAAQGTINITSGAELDAAAFCCTDATVKASSGGEAVVQVPGIFRANAWSSGSIRNTVQSKTADVSKSLGGKVVYFENTQS